jgi:hypothetical protein
MTFDVIVALAFVVLGIFGAGVFMGSTYSWNRVMRIFEDTDDGEIVRDSLGLHLEFTYTEPGSGVEVARVVSQWHDYV